MDFLWNMHLAPRWEELGLPLQVTCHVLACVVPLAVILFLYRHEQRFMSWLAAGTVTLMRVLVLAGLLFVLLLDPSFPMQKKPEEEPGRVVVAVDRSLSIDVPDPQRKPADKLRLALALRLNQSPDALCDDEQVRQWLDDYDKTGAPQWDRGATGATNDVETRVRLQAQHDRLCEMVDRVTRTQVADAVLSDDGLRRLFAGLGVAPPGDPKNLHGPNLVAALSADKLKVELVAFDGALRKAPADHPEALFAAPPSAVLAHSTDLSLPLAHGLETAGVGEGKLLGVVVLTDGRHNAGASPVEAAGKLGERQVPVYPVGLGCVQAPPQTTMLAMTVPTSMYKDASAGVDVDVRVAGLGMQKVEVELFRGAGDNKESVGKQTIEHNGTDSEYKRHFDVKMDHMGPQTLTAVVHPADPTVRVLNPADETRSSVVQVTSDHAHVLLIDGEARWEFHYLQSALKRDKTIETDSVVFDQPRLNTGLTDAALEDIGSPWEHLPAGPEALAKYDCVVLGDVSPEQLPPADRKRLEQFVADRGGTLVVVAGKRYMPMAYPEPPPAPKGGAAQDAPADPAKDDGADPIRKMLPIDQPRVIAPPDGFKPALTAEGRDTKFMEMEDDAGKNLFRWEALPPHYWAVVGKAKPAAAALAYAPDGPFNAKDPAAQERDNALIVRQNYGLGRVLYVGLDSTWRWRKGVGDAYHHRFWGQVSRWAADRPLQTNNRYLRFGSSEPVYKSGQDVELSVRFNDLKDAAKAAPGAQAEVRRRGDDNGPPLAVVELTRKKDQADALEAKVPNLPDGDYQVRLKMDAAPEMTQSAPAAPDASPGPVQALFSVTPEDSAEMADLSMNRPLLDELATRSGGAVYTPENVADLANDIKPKEVTVTRDTIDDPTREAWFAGCLFGALVLLLTVEWVVRKFSGLP